MRVFPIAAAVLALAAWTGCSSSNGGNGGPDQDVPPVDLGYIDDAQEPEDPGAGADGVEDQGTEPDVPQATYEIVFLSDTMFPQQVPSGQPFTIRARVRLVQDQTFVSGRQVDFAISRIETLDGEEVFKGDSSLTRPSSISNADGLVETVFQGGATVELLYTVTATSPDALPVSMRLVVLKMECGCLTVSLGYPGAPGSGASYQLSALTSDKKCADLNAATPLTGVVAEALGLDLTQPVQFQCPPPNTTVTLVVKGVENCPFAFGCVEGIVITGDKATETTPCPNTATVGLVATPMTLEGAFTGSHRLDVSAAFEDCSAVDPATQCGSPATLGFGRLVCCYLRAVEQAFAADAATVVAAIQAQADSWEGTLLTGDDGAKLDAALASLIPDKLASDSPAWVAKYAQVAARVTTALRQINLNSTITFGAEEDGKIPGTIVWDAYNPLYWKAGCDPSDPNFFACGKLVLPMASFGELAYAPTIQDSTFQASRVAGNRVVIEDHDVALNLGRLAAYFASDVASRVYSGGYIADNVVKGGDARSVEQAIAMRLPCATVATDLMSQISSWFTGTQADLETLCEEGLLRLLQQATDLRTPLIRPMRVTVSGSGAYADTSCDLKADRITQVEGVDSYEGTFHPPAGATSEVSGSLTAIRK